MKYILTRLPLDLANEWLPVDESLKCKVDELDDKGCSQNDTIYPVGPLRAHSGFVVICDEVFEIALAVRANFGEIFAIGISLYGFPCY